MEEQLADTLPIYREEAEKAILGSILIDEDEVFDKIISIIRTDFFYQPHHRALYGVMLEMHGSIRIDQLSIIETLRNKGLLERCGGAAYITSLPQQVPTISNVSYYCDLVAECAVRRELIRYGHNVIKEAHDSEKKVGDLVQVFESQLTQFSLKDGKEGVKSLNSVLNKLVEDIEDKMRSLKLYDGIETGYPKLDKLMTGFKNQQLIIVGARPSIGKTAFALSMAINMAIHQDIKVGFFSLEMSDIDIVKRLISAESRVSMTRVMTPQQMQNSDIMKIYAACKEIHEKPFYISAQPGMKLYDIKSTARMMKKELGVEIIFIDYIGLIELESGGSRPRHEVVSEISRNLKELARELDIPLVVLSQLTRGAETEDKDKEPILSNLRESGSIEQDADVVMLLHRPRITNDESGSKRDENEPRPTKVIVAKNRNGATDTIFLNFIPGYVRFESVAGENF